MGERMSTIEVPIEVRDRLTELRREKGYKRTWEVVKELLEASNAER